MQGNKNQCGRKRTKEDVEGKTKEGGVNKHANQAKSLKKP